MVPLSNPSACKFGPFESLRLKLKAGGSELIDLTVTDPTACGLMFPVNLLKEKILSYLNSRTSEPDPKGLKTARKAVKKYLESKWTQFAEKNGGVDLSIDLVSGLSEEQIYITSSTSESYAHIFRTISEPDGGPVLIPEPGYPLIEHLLAYQKTEVARYEILHHHDHWRVDSSQLSNQFASWPRPRGLVIISPHNPTGHVWSDDIGIPALPRETPIIADEVFAETSGRLPLSTAATLSDHPVFSLGGLSKSCGLADFKIGWIVLNKRASSQYGERLEFINDLFISANYLAQNCLEEILELQPQYENLVRERTTQNRNTLFTRLSRTTTSATTALGNYAPLRIRHEIEDEECAMELLNRGVVTHPGYFYGLPPGFIVITLLAQPIDFQLAVERIKTFTAD